MNSLMKGIERDYVIIASIFSLFIIAASLTNFAYSQTNQMSSNSSNEDNANANSVNIQAYQGTYIPTVEFFYI